MLSLLRFQIIIMLIQEKALFLRMILSQAQAIRVH